MASEISKELMSSELSNLTGENYLESQKKRDPAEFLKHMNSTMESFFFQRSYTRKNFDFYL